ncbi:hypothetical protein FC75_GL000555 [Lacticaseibacillus camelliae DSM 22697 = JCM 13995]|uniref:Uncharacterized protein n=1 Tax=Lacticaseibacillus camelliae DSM 22697 = JCM 13995 TaxID=1423730 RepID=A0A0R2EZQ5_9LACO|nr:hypothetical protein FC75_GL000555 [Lacticaseibacillus camelliae DSM 22697 = JCM 13995]
MGLEWKKQPWQRGLVGLLLDLLVLFVSLRQWQSAPLLLRDASWPQLSVGGGIAVLLTWTVGILAVAWLWLSLGQRRRLQ